MLRKIVKLNPNPLISAWELLECGHYSQGNYIYEEGALVYKIDCKICDEVIIDTSVDTLAPTGASKKHHELDVLGGLIPTCSECGHWETAHYRINEKLRCGQCDGWGVKEHKNE